MLVEFQFNGEQKINSGGSGNLGTNLGWAMAAIYMGGRLPQICLNVSFHTRVLHDLYLYYRFYVLEYF